MWCCRSERGHKRRREKREKIEWKEEEHGRSSKHRDREGEAPRDRDAREEKRRRGRDGEVRSERDRNGLDGMGEPGKERRHSEQDKELRRLRRRVGFSFPLGICLPCGRADGFVEDRQVCRTGDRVWRSSS